MTTYNGAKFLRAQLDSLSAQTVAPFELQIGDDGSDDETASIVQAFARTASFPVEFHRNENKLGFGENFLRTARRCSGDWIAFCDQDDVWLPQKLEVCAAVIAVHVPAIRFMCHNAWIADEALKPLRLLYDYREVEVFEPFDLAPEWFCVGFSQLIARELVEQVPIHPRPSIPWHPVVQAHDVWASLVGNAAGSIVRCAEPLVLYRRHEKNSTELGAETTRTQSLKAKLAGDGDLYLRRAGYAQSVAAILQSYADKMQNEELKTRFTNAAQKTVLHAAAWEKRALLYQGQSFSKRAKLMRLMILDGTYFGSQSKQIGFKALIKDLLNFVFLSLRL